MQQEQRLILKMLEEGKINAEEAEALLNALGEAEPKEEEAQEEPWARLEKMGEEFAAKVEAATERFAKSLEHKTEGLSEKLVKLPKILTRIPFVGFEQAHEFTQVRRGPVTAEEGEVIPIALSNFNGPICVEGWSEDGWQLIVVQRIRGRDRETLRDHLYKAEWADGEARDSFRLSIPDQLDRFVSLHLMVPRHRKYEVTTVSVNGSLRLENLKGTTVELRTTNGSVSTCSVRSERVDGRISNGSCKMDGVEADVIRFRIGNGSYRVQGSAREVDCVATNGSIDLRADQIPQTSNYTLQTVNGSITVKLPDQENVGTSVQLSTSVGRIHTSLGALENTTDERAGGGASFSGQTVGFAEKPVRLALSATTTSGSISVSTTEED
ncbi:MAG: DUF4097 family beta strand repeat-containing protein [Bacillota bacterium]|jgi:DUF4097 and DUF4098 domain-containing protein YvlB|nr:DUF4097 family beta strand repeat-containing protein [Bacillota bacterium]